MKLTQAIVISSEVKKGHDYDKVYVYHIEYINDGKRYKATLKQYIHQCISDFENYYQMLLNPGSSFIIGINHNNPSMIVTNMDFALIQEYKDITDIELGTFSSNIENGSILVNRINEIIDTLEIKIEERNISEKIILEIVLNALSVGITKFIINCTNLKEIVPNSNIFDRGTLVGIVGWIKRYFNAIPDFEGKMVKVIGRKEFIDQCKKFGTGIENDVEYSMTDVIENII